jgi:predicted PurR-regulated permease PerM
MPIPAFARYVLVIVGIVALAVFSWKIAPVLMLFFAGIVIATGIRAASVPLSRRFGVNDTVSVSIVFVLLIAVIGVGSYLFGKQINDQTYQLWQALTEAWEKTKAYLEATPLGPFVLESASAAQDPEAMVKVVKGTATVFGGILDVALVLFLAMYLAVDPKTYRNGFLLLLPHAVRDDVGSAIDASALALRKWLMGQLGAMVVVGVLTGIGLWAIGVPMALPLAILSGILDFVPFIGPLLAAIPGILIAFSISPQIAVYAALVYLTVQFVEGNIVLPLAQKWAVSLPPALSLLGIVAFGLAFGVLGALFAMPLTVVAVVMVQKLYVEKINTGV